MSVTAALARPRSTARIGLARRPVLVGAIGAKAADLLTTVVGLTLVVGVREGSPIPAAAIDAAGILPGLLALAGLAIAILVVGVELPTRLVSGPRRGHLRRLAYGAVGTIWLAAAAHNTLLLTGVLPL